VLEQDYAALENAYQQSLQNKKNKKPPKLPSKHKPANVLTCVEKMAAEPARIHSGGAGSGPTAARSLFAVTRRAQRLANIFCLKVRNLPKFGVFYDMFCDLVHPNIGSNILLYSISKEGSVTIDRSREIQIGRKIIEETFGGSNATDVWSIERAY
jgi:hypothetical protein